MPGRGRARGEAGPEERQERGEKTGTRREDGNAEKTGLSRDGTEQRREGYTGRDIPGGIHQGMYTTLYTSLGTPATAPLPRMPLVEYMLQWCHRLVNASWALFLGSVLGGRALASLLL